MRILGNLVKPNLTFHGENSLLVNLGIFQQFLPALSNSIQLPTLSGGSHFLSFSFYLAWVSFSLISFCPLSTVCAFLRFSFSFLTLEYSSSFSPSFLIQFSFLLFQVLIFFLSLSNLVSFSFISFCPFSTVCAFLCFSFSFENFGIF